MKFNVFNLQFAVRRVAALPPAVLLLGVMLTLYPLLVVPHPWGTDFAIMERTVAVPPSYFYAPRYFLLALAGYVYWRARKAPPAPVEPVWGRGSRPGFA